jgi:hypothetical protein
MVDFQPYNVRQFQYIKKTIFTMRGIQTKTFIDNNNLPRLQLQIHILSYYNLPSILFLYVIYT